MSFEVTGIEKVQAGFNAALERIGFVTEKAMHDIALDLQGKAQRLAPKETGHLRESAYTKFEGEGTNKISATVGFNATVESRAAGKSKKKRMAKLKEIVESGAEAVSYAIIQHERTDFHHTDGQAKFLETPFKENRDKYIKWVEKDIRKGIK